MKNSICICPIERRTEPAIGGRKTLDGRRAKALFEGTEIFQRKDGSTADDKRRLGAASRNYGGHLKIPSSPAGRGVVATTDSDHDNPIFPDLAR